MKLVQVKTPWLVKKTFPNFIWDLYDNKVTTKTIYLTFDDGPTPIITEKVLDILTQYNAKATFFCIGKNIKQHPTIFERIINERHAIGNHTFNHLKGWKSDTITYLNNIIETKKTIQQINKSTNQQKLFRPPYGRIKLAQANQLQKLGYKIIMWDVLTFDWNRKIPSEKVLKNTIDNAKSGSIIVFHDSIKASKNMLYALPKALDYFSKKGFVFKKLEIN